MFTNYKAILENKKIQMNKKIYLVILVLSIILTPTFSALAQGKQIILKPEQIAQNQADKVYFDKQSVRDPFIAPIAFEQIDEESQILLEKALANAKIMGIAIDGDKKYVIINDRIIEEKSKWRDLVIDEIGKDYFMVIYRGTKTKIPYKSGL